MFGFFTESEYPLKRYLSSKSLPDLRPLTPEDFNIEGFLDDCDRLFELHEACGGDFIFSGSIFWGVPWIEAALGCSIVASHETGSIHSVLPVNFDGKASSIPYFDEDSPWVKKAGEYLVKISERSHGRWPVGTTRMRGISDLLSALYGSADFIYAMLENPDAIHAVCEKLSDFYISFARYQLDHIPLFHGGIGSFYYHMWTPAGTVWHQEDAAALLSPTLYDEFIRPYNEKIIKAFPGNIMHQHPVNFLPTNSYIEMGMTALEMHIDEGGPSAKALYPRHMSILKEKPLLIWGRLSESDFEWIFTQLPSKGLAVMAVVDGIQEASQLWERYRKKIMTVQAGGGIL